MCSVSPDSLRLRAIIRSRRQWRVPRMRNRRLSEPSKSLDREGAAISAASRQGWGGRRSGGAGGRGGARGGAWEGVARGRGVGEREKIDPTSMPAIFFLVFFLNLKGKN